MKLLFIIPLVVSLSSASASTLRGSKDISESELGGWGQLKCMVEGKTDKLKCSESVNGEGDACSFCVLKDPDSGSEAGLCVDPAVAPQMEQMNPQIKCDAQARASAGTEPVTDYHDFKCTIKGFNDPDKCSHMRTDDGAYHCQYCSMDGPFGEKGLCVSPEHAEAMKKLSPDLKCVRQADTDRSALDVVSY